MAEANAVSRHFLASLRDATTWRRPSVLVSAVEFREKPSWIFQSHHIREVSWRRVSPSFSPGYLAPAVIDVGSFLRRWGPLNGDLPAMVILITAGTFQDRAEDFTAALAAFEASPFGATAQRATVLVGRPSPHGAPMAGAFAKGRAATHIDAGNIGPLLAALPFWECSFCGRQLNGLRQVTEHEAAHLRRGSNSASGP